MDSLIRAWQNLRAKIRQDTKSLKIIKVLNDILPTFHEHMRKIEDVNSIIYIAALTTVRVLKFKQNHTILSQRNSNFVPPWKKRLESKMANFRSKLTKLLNWKRGRTSQKINKKVTIILKNHGIKSQRENKQFETKFNELIDFLKKKNSCTW